MKDKQNNFFNGFYADSLTTSKKNSVPHDLLLCCVQASSSESLTDMRRGVQKIPKAPLEQGNTYGRLQDKEECLIRLPFRFRLINCDYLIYLLNLINNHQYQIYRQ